LAYKVNRAKKPCPLAIFDAPLKHDPFERKPLTRAEKIIGGETVAGSYRQDMLAVKPKPKL
jgi:hypothetical protein